jgi:hypothetical protein
MNGQRADKLWFTIAALAILVLSSIPNWAGYYAETGGIHFRGIYTNPSDYAANISMMHAGELGEWKYQMRFTNEPHPAAFVRMFHILLGHVSALLNLDVEITFQIARWIFGATALYSIYLLCKKIFPEEINYARAAFLLAALGSGLGWLQLIFGVPLKPISPIDFWLTDAYVFFSISLFPAFAYTLTLMTAGLNLFLDYLQNPKRSTVAWICVIAAACQITNPIAFAVIDIAFAGAVLFKGLEEGRINKEHVYALSAIAISQIPLLVYNYAVLIGDPVWRQYTLQNETLSPPPTFYFWGFAPFWIFALIGIAVAIRQRSQLSGALLGWTFSGFALAYLPVAIQRRFLLGITIPLGIFAIIGLKTLIEWGAQKTQSLIKQKNVILLAYISLASISSLYLVLGLCLYMQSRSSREFYPDEMEQALIWLDEHAKSNEFVLSSPQSGEIIAQRTHLKVYIGHKMETIFFERKAEEVSAFFQENAEPGWLENTSAKWIFFGPYEKQLTGNKDFTYEKGQIAYKSAEITIYEIEK